MSLTEDAGLSGGKSLVCERRLGWQSAPELAGHRIRGLVVVPMAWLALEVLKWCREVLPRNVNPQIVELRKFRGMTLPEFEEEEALFRWELEGGDGEAGERGWELAIQDEQGRKLYEMRLVGKAGRGERPNSEMSGGWTRPWDAVWLYERRGLLFHQGLFRTIERVLVLGEDFVKVELKIPEAARVAGKVREVVLDAAVQALALWVWDRSRDTMLPSAVGVLELWQAEELGLAKWACARILSRTLLEVRADAWVEDGEGRVLAVWRDLCLTRVVDSWVLSDEAWEEKGGRV
ncbi:MAG: hypothetical protein HC904_11315 [Blastochloris sp.]|nr:hypothetical protein [Blastochloris sp.]